MTPKVQISKCSGLWAFVVCITSIGCTTLDDKVGNSHRSREVDSSALINALTAAPDEGSHRVLNVDTTWRAATSRELRDSVAWISHILIRHSGVAPNKMSFSPDLWNAAPLPPRRSRDEAFALTSRIANQAHSNPQEFGRLAVRWSEDIATATGKGSLGGVGLDRLRPWPQVLDAITATPIGGVSSIVETQYGLHIFHRRPSPADELVAGERIVIAYDSAPWLSRYLSYREVPPRSRAQARNVAQGLYESARRSPTKFHELVHEHSDHRDAMRKGDFGAWSSIERSPFPREIEVLQRLQVGEVAPPIDSLFGFQIIKRTPNTDRQLLAAAWIRVRYDKHSRPGDESSRAARIQVARTTLRQMQSGKLDFSAAEVLHRTQATRKIWPTGRESPQVETAVLGVPIGHLARQLAEENESFLIVQRLDPDEFDPE